jgi:hypothetical protein
MDLTAMNNRYGLAFCALCLLTANAAELSVQEREQLLERLEKLQSTASQRVEARFRAAVSAYTAAAASPSSASDFYIKCVEQVDFVDQKRKSQDFRDWKRRESDRVNSRAFGLTAQSKLRWLILTLQAAAEQSNSDQLAKDAKTIVGQICENHSIMAPHRKWLSQAVLSSVFARAYQVDQIQIDNWPAAPTDIAAIYQQVILPPLRAKKDPKSLLSAWNERIQQEIQLRDNTRSEDNSNGRRIGTTTSIRSPEFDRFLSETLPNLQWEMEVDLYRHGDARNAAGRMLAHIEKHITHESATRWSEQLTGMLTPEMKTTPIE